MITDVPDGELAPVYAALAASICEVWPPRGGAETVAAPWGPCTALEAARGFTLETVTHGWDLAVTTGQPSEAPNGIAGRCLASAAPIIPGRLRGVMYDAPVVTGDALSPTEELAHLLGHKRDAPTSLPGHGQRPPS